jgi:hypothetical protein
MRLWECVHFESMAACQRCAFTIATVASPRNYRGELARRQRYPRAKARYLLSRPMESRCRIIARRTRLQQRFHAITCMPTLRWFNGMRSKIEIHTQSACCRKKNARRFHVFQIYFVAKAPRWLQRIFPKTLRQRRATLVSIAPSAEKRDWQELRRARQ